GDVAEDAVALTLRHERAALRLVVERLTDASGAATCRECFDELVMATLRDDDARERRAHLAVEPALGARERLGGGPEVHVVEHHRRRLPAELEGAARDPLTAQRRDAPAGRGRPRERDLVDA